MSRYFDYHLFTVAGTEINVATVVIVAIILIATLIIARVLEGATERALKIRRVEDEGTIGVARRLVHYMVLIIGLAIGLNTIGIDLSALFAAGAIFAVAIGFAMQNIVQNFVSGTILLVERAIKPGDILEVEGQVVRVSRMGIRATVSRTLDEEEIIIPNSTLVQDSVKNYTLRDRLYRLRTVVGVVYSSDMALVRNTLEKALTDLPWRIQTIEPRILMREFGDSSVNFDVSVWIDAPWEAQQRKSQLNEAVWWALKEKEIVIAFPQLDLHFDPYVETSLKSLSKLPSSFAPSDRAEPQ